MKFGVRIPSLRKRLTARVSVKRAVRHRLGVKAPRGLGIVTDPKKALSNRVYNKTTVGCPVPAVIFLLVLWAVLTSTHAGSFAFASPALAGHRRCTGAKDCRVCSNCKYCAYCSVPGHTCGVCAGDKASTKHRPSEWRRKVPKKARKNK